MDGTNSFGVHLVKPFPPQQKTDTTDRTTVVLYTKYVRNTKNYVPPEPKKLCNTTPQLYGTLST